MDMMWADDSDFHIENASFSLPHLVRETDLDAEMVEPANSTQDSTISVDPHPSEAQKTVSNNELECSTLRHRRDTDWCDRRSSASTDERRTPNVSQSVPSSPSRVLSMHSGVLPFTLQTELAEMSERRRTSRMQRTMSHSSDKSDDAIEQISDTDDDGTVPESLGERLRAVWEGLVMNKRTWLCVLLLAIGFVLLGVLQFDPLPWQGWASIAVLLLTLGLLSSEALPVAVVFCVSSTILMVLGIISAADALAGFSQSGIATVAALFVVAEGLQRTSTFVPVLRIIMINPRNLWDAMFRIMIPTALLSGFMNNTPIVAMMLPVVRKFSLNTGIPASLLYMPLNIAAVLGGTLTMIGTSTNLVVQGLMEKDALIDPATGEPVTLSIFSISKIGAVVSLTGILATVLLAPLILPRSREGALGNVLDNPRKYTVSLRVQERSVIVGETVAAAGLRHLKGLYLAEITRENGEIVAAPPRGTRLRANDTLLFVGIVESVKELYHISGLTPDIAQSSEIDVERHRRELVEVVIAPGSSLVAKNVRSSRFRQRFGSAIIAVCREGDIVRTRIGDIVLRGGDLLLLETSASGGVDRLKHNGNFALVSRVSGSTPMRENSYYMVFCFVLLVGMILWSQLNDTNLFICASLVALVMVAGGCMTMQQAGQAVPVHVVVAIAASFGLSVAMDSTGVATQLARVIVRATHRFGAAGAIFGIYITSTFLTEVITNNAAAALMYPIVKSIVEDTGLPPRAGLFALMMGASASFATPIGYQTNLMVHSVAGYRFTDWMKMGIPLILLLSFVTTATIWAFET